MRSTYFFFHMGMKNQSSKRNNYQITDHTKRAAEQGSITLLSESNPASSQKTLNFISTVNDKTCYAWELNGCSVILWPRYLHNRQKEGIIVSFKLNRWSLFSFYKFQYLPKKDFFYSINEQSVLTFNKLTKNFISIFLFNPILYASHDE